MIGGDVRYSKQIELADGAKCLLRSEETSDSKAFHELMHMTHGQTDFLLSYPDETGDGTESEARDLTDRRGDDRAIEIGAFVGERLVGTAEIEPSGDKDKVRHRAEFGISVDRAFWHRGIGRALTSACVECARRAGYLQLELEVVGTNTAALALYHDVGFVEYGRNPRGFRTRDGRWQELVLMRLELEG
jgi:RimJ/RimL family protein N-acetyltransferase